MKAARPSVVITADGSHSLYIEALDEHYHSVHGAIQESKHVFIEAGLKHRSSLREICLLEVGFGTGLNAFLTFLESLRSEQKIHYTTLEAFPLEPALIAALNYPALLREESKDMFTLLHTSEWEKDITVTSNFILHKKKQMLQELNAEQKYDLIYFDAFSPNVQPELWTEGIFAVLFESLDPGGCLLTYCAKGEVKRNLKKAGFRVETLPGPPGKREMVRAVREK